MQKKRVSSKWINGINVILPHINTRKHQNDRASVAKYNPLSRFVGFSISLNLDMGVC